MNHLSAPIVLYAASPDIVIVDKPSSIPVHPAGQFRHNTLSSLIWHRYQLQVRFVHRLDRVTSGLMLGTLNPGMAQTLSKQMRERLMKKHYLARVIGRFPASSQPIVVSRPIACASAKFAQYTCTGDVAEKSGKPSETHFRGLIYDPATNTSLVHCRPFTGRTHQIRLHLQYLGHPIANDIRYGGQAGMDFPHQHSQDHALELQPQPQPQPGLEPTQTHDIKQSLLPSHIPTPTSTSTSTSAQPVSTLSYMHELLSHATPPLLNVHVAPPVSPQLLARIQAQAFDPLCNTCKQQQQQQSQTQTQPPQAQSNPEASGSIATSNPSSSPTNTNSSTNGHDMHIRDAGLPNELDSEPPTKRHKVGQDDDTNIQDPDPVADHKTTDADDEVDEAVDPDADADPDLLQALYGIRVEMIWLHAFRYEGPDWAYQIPWPKWAAVHIHTFTRDQNHSGT